MLYYQIFCRILNNYGVALYTAEIIIKQEGIFRALRLAPDNLWTLNNLGSIYAQEGNYKKQVIYEKSIQKSPTQQHMKILRKYSLTEKPSETLNFKQALIIPNSAKLNQLAALSSQAIQKRMKPECMRKNL